MYDKNDILDLEAKILAIYVYYSYIQISFNNYCHNGNKEALDVCQKVGNARLVIGKLRSLLFKLTPIRYPKPVNYSEVASRLYYLGSLSRKHHQHRNEMIWADTISIVERSSFSAVFGHFISRLRTLTVKFNSIEDKYRKLSHNEIREFERELLSLNTYLLDFISYIQAVKIMLDYIDKEKIFASASYDEDFVPPKKIIPMLRIVK